MVDLALLDADGAEAHDALAETLEAGGTVVLGAVPTTGPLPGERQVVETVLRWLDMLGLDPDEAGDRLLVSPACGMAGADMATARTALERVVRAARQ
jgi:methionine synthase II (cobalamin-independent)